ncbi:hypothetical protein ABT235_02035 [Micromonospora echinofusca]|uniref:hypothetical protein n=1 Tax=Micromonospora echinofusca TaxID=47858 RepID=UPI0013043501
MQGDADAAGELDWLLTAVDSTVIRAHQHPAGLRPGKDHDAMSRPTIATAGRETS